MLSSQHEGETKNGVIPRKKRHDYFVDIDIMGIQKQKKRYYAREIHSACFVGSVPGRNAFPHFRFLFPYVRE